MLLRSMLMNSVAPLRAADGVVGGGASGVDAGTAAVVAAEAAPAAAAAAPAETAAPAVGAAAAPAADAAPALEQPKSTPSLLEAAEGKPKPEAKAADAAKPADKAVEEKTPAPADAAKPDEAKPAEAKGDEEKPDAKKDDAKPDDAAKATDPAKDATAEIQPPAPVKYEAFKLPDGIKLDDKELSKFTDIIGAAQVKQDVAQNLIDLYVAEKKADIDAARTEQRRVWDTLNDTWKTELRSDKELGGNRLETSLSMAKAVIEEYGGNADQVRELLAHTTNNGMGNFPGFVRLLHNIAKSLNVFEDGIVAANPTAPKPSKGPGNRGWYDKSQGNGAAAS